MTGANSVLKAFGGRLRLLRKTRGWTQEELARRTNRHWTYIGGLERGERNPTLLVLCDLATTLDVRPSDLLDEDHELLTSLNASAKDILDAIQRGFRAQIDVKGKLAELYMNRQLNAFRVRGLIEECTWQDIDGKPDFTVKYRKRELTIECKNVRNEAYRRPPSYKVELQRTRNSMDGTPTRGYRASEFDVLGVALFNQTGRWDLLYVATKHLERRPAMPDYLQIMQRVPMASDEIWTADALRAFDAALGGSR